MHWNVKCCDNGLNVRLTCRTQRDGRMYRSMQFPTSFVPDYVVFFLKGEECVGRLIRLLKTYMPSSCGLAHYHTKKDLRVTSHSRTLFDGPGEEEGTLCAVSNFRNGSGVRAFLRRNADVFPPFDDMNCSPMSKVHFWFWFSKNIEADFTSTCPWLIRPVGRGTKRTALVTPLPSNDETDRILVGCFDIECVDMEGSYSGIPVGHKINHVCVMISFTVDAFLSTGEREPVSKTVFFLRPDPGATYPESAGGAKCVGFDSEGGLLGAFLCAVVDSGVCYLSGYNVLMFDVPFLVGRCFHKLQSVFFSREVFENSVRSGKDDVSYSCKIMGVPVVDYYDYVKRFSGRNLPSKKLGYVAQTKIGRTKVDLRVTEIGDMYRLPSRATGYDRRCWLESEPEAWSAYPGCSGIAPFAVALEYCSVDSELVSACLNEDSALANLNEFASYCCENASHICSGFVSDTNRHTSMLRTTGPRHMGVFFSPILYERQSRPVPRDENGVPMPGELDLRYEKARYQGAVNVGRPNLYSKVVSIDVEGQYPSICRSKNLSAETCCIVYSEVAEKLLASRPGLYVCPYENHDSLESTAAYGTASADPPFPETRTRYAMVSDTTREGLFCKAMAFLVNARNVAKAAFKRTGKRRYETQSLALKILANTGYGLTGVAGGDQSGNVWSLRCLHVAASITCHARLCLCFISRVVSERFPRSPVVYADTDSVFCENAAGLGTEMEAVVNDKLKSAYAPASLMKVSFENEFATVLVLAKKKMITSSDDVKFMLKGGARQVHPRTSGWLQLAVTLCKSDPRPGYDEVMDRLLEEAASGCNDPTFTMSRTLGKDRDAYSDNNKPAHARVQANLWKDKGVSLERGTMVEYGHAMWDVLYEEVRDNPLHAPDLMEAFSERGTPVDSFEHLKSVYKTVFSTISAVFFDGSDDAKDRVRADWCERVVDFKRSLARSTLRTVYSLAYLEYGEEYELISVLPDSCYYTDRPYL